MELILIILTSTFISAFLLLSFFLGYHFALKKEQKEDVAIELNETNKEKVEQMLNFLNFNGDRKWK